MLDVNDETPTFFPAVYNVSVSEDVPREFRVVWLNCTDNDVGLNAELSYFVTGVALPPCPSDERPAWSGLGKYPKVNPRKRTLSPALGSRAPQSSSLCEFCNTPTDIQHQARAKVFSTFTGWVTLGKSLNLSELHTPRLK